MTAPTPEVRRICRCGHGATEHPRFGSRVCTAAGCPCSGYDRLPQSACAHPGCHHPPTFHSHRDRSDTSCQAIACPCAAWAAPEVSPEPQHQAPRTPMITSVTTPDLIIQIEMAAEVAHQLRVTDKASGDLEILLSRQTRARASRTQA